MNDDTLELDPRFRVGLAHLWAESRDRHLGAADEILAGLASGDTGEAGSAAAAAAAHRLAGTLGVFGLPDASDLAGRIESALESGASRQVPTAELRALAVRLRSAIVEHDIASA